MTASEIIANAMVKIKKLLYLIKYISKKVGLDLPLQKIGVIFIFDLESTCILYKSSCCI